MHASLNKYLWKCRIDISAYTEEDQHFVILREPNTAEFKELLKLQVDLEGDDINKQIDGIYETLNSFVDLAKTLIVDHNFYEEDAEGKKLTSKDIAEFLGSKTELAQFVMGEYLNQLPLLKGSDGK